MTNYAKPRRAFFSAGVRGIGFCLCLAVILLQPTMGRSAIDDQSARAFIEGLADTAIAALTPPDVPQAEREARAKQLLRDNFAIETIGQFVLGRYWRTATADERAEYLRLFEELIVSTYVDRFKRYTGQRLKVTGSTDQPDGDVLVNSEIERAGGGTPVAIGWRVRDLEGRLQIVDVNVEGVSMGQTQRSDFSSVIRNTGGTVAGLLDEMRKRIRNNANAG
ncbi:MAG: ABC transporter substrate-binding protein [Rhodospirillales bacterium]